jgi:hypothetical protein
VASPAHPASTPAAWRFPYLADVWNSNDGRLKGFILGFHYAMGCHPAVDKRHRDVLDAIIQCANDDGVVTPEQVPELATWTDEPEEAVLTRLRELSAAGFLEALPHYKPPALRAVRRDR